MLDHLTGVDRLTWEPPRKQKHFACACARLVWDGLPDVCRRVVEDLQHGADSGDPVWPGQYTQDHFDAAYVAAPVALRGDFAALMEVLFSWTLVKSEPPGPALAAGRRAQAPLVRDIFGNPFRPAPRVEPDWLSWNGGTVAGLALAAYEQRQLPAGHLDPARLLVLADALEESGCSDADLLGHLRGPGPHVRGCFAVDALLGRR
jgi:hypothetical protein